MQREKQLLYEVFVLLGTHNKNPKRKSFPINYIEEIKQKISVDLRREVLEKSMKELPATSADNILESLNDSLDKSNSKADKALAKEEMECEEDESEDCNDDEDEDTNRPPTKQKLKKNTLHPLIMKNPWEVGNGMFA